MYYIEFRRKELRLQQQELGRRARVNRAIVSGIEHGRVVPNPAELSRLAEVLHVERPDALIERVQIVPPEKQEAGS